MANLKNRLADKDYEFQLKELTERYQELWIYKSLCEKRILELDPEHPLPIKPEHLGNTEPIKGRTQSNLTGHGNSDKDRAEFLESEKAAVEATLREEVLNNEEQRNYIELLKQAIEAKIEELGLREFLSEIVEEGKDSNEVFARLALMKNEIVAKEKAMAAKEEDISDMEGIIIDLKKETEELKKELEDQRKQLAKTQDKCLTATNDKNEMQAKYDIMLSDVIYILMLD